MKSHLRMAQYQIHRRPLSGDRFRQGRILLYGMTHPKGRHPVMANCLNQAIALIDHWSIPRYWG
jgi:hypothetical protein